MLSGSHYKNVCAHGYIYGQCRCPSKEKSIVQIECPVWDERHKKLKEEEEKLKGEQKAKAIAGGIASDVDQVMQEATILQNRMNQVFLDGVKSYVEELRNPNTGEIKGFGYYMKDRLASELWDKVL